MTRLRKPADPASPLHPPIPSATDPVDAWLDVLVAMLSIPRVDRQTVRDELEDHLRSRIDDLLIHGLTETQALQKAVAELGETADLARQLSHAHKPPRTRRYAMHALVIALAGTVVALGVNTMRPGTRLPVVAAVQGESVSVSHAEELISVRDRTIGEVLDDFKSRADRPVMIHWKVLQDIDLVRDAPTQIDSDPLNFSTIVRLLAERGEPVLQDSIAILETPDLIEVGARSQFDQRTMLRRSYDLSQLVGYAVMHPVTGQQASISRAGVSYTGNDGVLGLAMLLQTHVAPRDWVAVGGDLARYSAMGNVLVITAPGRIHVEIEATIAELIEAQRVSYREGQTLAQSRYQVIDGQHQRLESQYQNLFDRWSEVTKSRADAKAEGGKTDFERVEIIERTRTDLVNQMQAIRIRQSAIATQMDELARTWELQRSDRAAGAYSVMEPPTGKVAYFISRPGDSVAVVLSDSEELTIRQMLAANGIDPDNPPAPFVTHYRSGQPRDQAYRVSVQMLFLNPNLDRVLRSGDTVLLDIGRSITAEGRR